MRMSEWKVYQEVRRSGCGAGEFENARGLTVSRDTRNVIIADINNKRIQILDKEGKFLHQWPIFTNDMKLCPLGVHRINSDVVAAVIEGHTSLWVCPDVTDYSKVEIKMSLSFGNDQFIFPRDVTSSARGHLYVTDVGKHRMSVHDMSGRLLKSIGSLGKDDASQFNWPYYVCTDGCGRVVVSDSHNRKLKIFDQDLNFISCFGDGHLTCATGVAYSDQDGGCFLVGDYDTKSLLRFSMDGRFIEFVDEDIDLPLGGIDVDTHGRVCASMYDGLRVYSDH